HRDARLQAPPGDRRGVSRHARAVALAPPGERGPGLGHLLRQEHGSLRGSDRASPRMTESAMTALTQTEIDQRVLDLYDEYCHGGIDRREFLRRAGLIAGGLAMAQALLPRYALAQTIYFTDTRIKARYVTYPSPGGTSGTMRGYLVQPAGPGP